MPGRRDDAFLRSVPSGVATVASASAGAHRAKSWRNEGSGGFRGVKAGTVITDEVLDQVNRKLPTVKVTLPPLTQ